MQPADGPSAVWDGHLVLVHEGEHQRRAGVAEWVRRGLALNAKIVYIERPDEPTDRSLRNVLRGQGLEVEDAVARGQLQVFCADDGRVFSPTWQAGVLRRALADGYSTVRLSGEAATAWTVMPPPAHASLEWATEELCRSRRVSVLCQYPSDLMEATMQTVCAMHGDGVCGSLVRTSPVHGGLAVVGEVDWSNAGLLHSALSAATVATEDHRDRFILDVGGLEFIDVAGVRALVSGTSAYRATGGVVCLRGVRPAVSRLLDLLELDRVVGFAIEERSQGKAT
jgi:anti-anti-sigma factor